MCVAEVVMWPFSMKHTGMASSAPPGNRSLISKPSATIFSRIGLLEQHSISFILDSINSCAITQPYAKSLAQKANATSRAHTD